MASVRVTPDTKFRLDGLKMHPQESYDKIINRLIDSYQDDDPLSKEDIEGIAEALRELKEGRFFTHEQVKEKLGLSQEKPLSLIYAPRAVKDLEEISAGAPGRIQNFGLAEPDRDEIQKIAEYEKRKSTHSLHLNSL